MKMFSTNPQMGMLQVGQGQLFWNANSRPGCVVAVNGSGSTKLFFCSEF